MPLKNYSDRYTKHVKNPMKTFAIPKFMFHGFLISLNKEMSMNINYLILYFVRRGMDKIDHIQ